MHIRSKQAALIGAILVPFWTIAAVTIVMGYRNLTTTAIRQRQYIAEVASQVLHDRLTSLESVAVFTAKQPALIAAVEQKQWKRAAAIVREVPSNFPDIDRVLLVDTKGIEWGAFPWDDSVIGKDFSHRDWYKGVTQSWQPYVSEAYRRAAKPTYNVVGIAVPIWKEPGKAVGIIVLQIKLDQFFQWIRHIDVGNGTLFFVDQHGNVAGHPLTSASGSIVRLNPETCTAIAGSTTADPASVTNDPVTGGNRVILGARVDPFGWTAYYSEDPALLFATRREAVTFLFQLYALGTLLGCLAGLRLSGTLWKLQSTESFLESIVENIPDMIFVKDAKTLSFMRFNRAGEELLGQNRSELLGKNDYDFFPKDQADFFTEKDRNVLKMKKIVDIPEEPINTSRGMRYLHTKKVPIVDKRGTPRYLLGISEDITEKKALEEAKAEFVSLASHQLRTPLSTIRWASELLLESSKDQTSTQHQLIRNIHEAVLGMTELTQTMLMVSRIEANTIRKHPVKIDLDQLLHDIIKEYQSLWEKKRQRVSCSCRTGTTVTTDTAMLHEIVLNLVANAIAYTPDGGTISIDVTTENHAVIITIMDNGIGIPSCDHEHIFERLYRASNATALNVNGTGLGLYVAKSFTGLLGGTLTFTSEEGRGTRFRLSIPVL